MVADSLQSPAKTNLDSMKRYVAGLSNDTEKVNKHPHIYQNVP